MILEDVRDVDIWVECSVNGPGSVIDAENTLNGAVGSIAMVPSAWLSLSLLMFAPTVTETAKRLRSSSSSTEGLKNRAADMRETMCLRFMRGPSRVRVNASRSVSGHDHERSVGI